MQRKNNNPSADICLNIKPMLNILLDQYTDIKSKVYGKAPNKTSWQIFGDWGVWKVQTEDLSYSLCRTRNIDGKREKE